MNGGNRVRLSNTPDISVSLGAESMYSVKLFKYIVMI